MDRNGNSKLLIDETPLTVLPGLVKLIGLEKAVILQQIQYLTQNPKIGRILDDGQKYIWETAQEFSDNFFPFWKPRTISKHLRELEKLEYLISRQPLAADWNHTKFYRLNYELLNEKIKKQASTPINSECYFNEHSNVTFIDNRMSSKVTIDSSSELPSIKEAKTSSKTSSKTTHTQDARAQEPPENGVCVDSQNISNPKPADGHLSRYSIPECRQYIAFCDSRDGNIKSIKLVAEKIYKDGLSDDDMKEYFDSLIEKPPEVKREIIAKKENCPRCFGTGLEFVYSISGTDLGVKPNCKHEPLRPGEWLFEWNSKRAREDLDDAPL